MMRKVPQLCSDKTMARDEQFKLLQRFRDAHFSQTLLSFLETVIENDAPLRPRHAKVQATWLPLPYHHALVKAGIHEKLREFSTSALMTSLHIELFGEAPLPIRACWKNSAPNMGNLVRKHALSMLSR